MAFDKEWNENIPEGTESISLGDDRIRDFKYAIRERLAKTLHFYANETGIPNIGELKDGIVKTNNIASNAIVTDKVANDAITSVKLSPDAAPTYAVNVAVNNVFCPAAQWITLAQIGPIAGRKFAWITSRFKLITAGSGAVEYMVRYLQNGVVIYQETMGTHYDSGHHVVDDRFFAIEAFGNSIFTLQFCCMYNNWNCESIRFGILWA